jgi:hypothetical protein
MRCYPCSCGLASRAAAVLRHIEEIEHEGRHHRRLCGAPLSLPWKDTPFLRFTGGCMSTRLTTLAVFRLIRPPIGSSPRGCTVIIERSESHALAIVAHFNPVVSMISELKSPSEALGSRNGGTQRLEEFGPLLRCSSNDELLGDVGKNDVRWDAFVKGIHGRHVRRMG